MKLFSSKRRMAVVAALVLLLLFVLRPGASRLKSRIISSLSAGVGRPVDVGSVHVRLLPRPGFDLNNLVVYDDPEFGAEPMLRASEVTADLRLTSLVRGRLEIARLNLTDPSLNIVHTDGGRWNLSALLERTAHTPLAPTGKAKSEPRPAFPYIAASSGRINFKNGPEKKPYALTNADFALWQDSENAWGVRLKAQPVRTDLNLTDTGLLQINGTWTRAATLHDTPLQFSLEWSRAQVGQVTKLFSGNDKGWRGAILLDVALSGTPAKLQIESTASIDDFRRYDIAAGRALRLAASCDAEYSSLSHEFHEVKCNAPVGNGQVTVAGDLGFPGSRRYALTISAEDVPASAVAALAQRSKKSLPEDLLAEGTLQAKVLVRDDIKTRLKPRVEGRGAISDFRLSSAADNATIAPTTVAFMMANDAAPSAEMRREKSVEGKNAMAVPEGPHVVFAPVPIEGVRSGGATARGWIDFHGYNFSLVGDTEIARILHLARLVGVPAQAVIPEGSATLDLHIAGSWAAQSASYAGFVGPQVSGIAKLHTVRVAAHGGPVEIASGEMQLLPDAVRVTKLKATAAGSTWNGSIEMPRGCGSVEGCPVQFALSTDEAALSQINEWASPRPKKRAWYEVLGESPKPSWLARVHASGKVSAERFRIHLVTATHVSADLSLDAGKLQLSSVKASFLGGKYQGKWQAEFGVKPSICRSSGILSGISLAQVATLMKDAWIAGTGNAGYEVKGSCSAEFWQSAEGPVQVDMSEGVLPHLMMREDSSPLRVTRVIGQARLRDGQIEIDSAKVDSTEGRYEVSGTATLERELNLKLTSTPSTASNAGYSVTGTLSAPKVAPLARTEQANLKPISSK